MKGVEWLGLGVEGLGGLGVFLGVRVASGVEGFRVAGILVRAFVAFRGTSWLRAGIPCSQHPPLGLEELLFSVGEACFEKPSARSPKQILKFEAQQEPENPNPKTQNPKPQTLNPKP